MIAEIRSYLKSQVLAYDSDMKENKSAFYDSDIGESIIDMSFQIELNNINNIVRNSHVENEIDVNVIIFGQGYKDEIAHYDKLLEKAICIRDNIINIKNFSGIETITNITAESINSQKIDGNDNAFQITINLTLTQAYIREDW